MGPLAVEHVGFVCPNLFNMQEPLQFLLGGVSLQPFLCVG
jgi:hypothetical protein